MKVMLFIFGIPLALFALAFLSLFVKVIIDELFRVS